MSLPVIILLVIIFLLLLILFIPLRIKVDRVINREARIDERDTMFARNELKPGEERYTNYYNANPGLESIDMEFRKKPGLLSDKSTYFNVLAFAAANASFHTIGHFAAHRKGEAGERVSDPAKPALATAFIRNMLLKAGAIDSGVTVMQPYHFYSLGGRRERYGKEVEPKHKYGIAILVEMDHEMTSAAPNASIVMESASRYLTSGILAVHCAETIRQLGYEATAHIDGNYDLVCPLVAADAGLGEIGRMGLLMHPLFGPRVRIAVVTTDMPLVPSKKKIDDSVIHFCNICEKCADCCPARSIQSGPRRMIVGSLRWQVDQASCYSFWCSAGTDCGRCMSVCPYSHGGGAFHNFVRWGIRNNYLFAWLALKLDDIFYGRKPAPKGLPAWMDNGKQ